MDHKVTEHELTGGARLLAVQIPNTITFYWGSFFRAGWRFITNEPYELPHIAEHMAFTGTKSYPDDIAFKVEIERDGTYYNASTSSNQVSYYFVGSREEIKRIIPLNMSQIYEPLYRKEHVKQEQQVITREMSRYKENDNWRANYNAWHLINPRTNPDIDKRISEIATITVEDMRTYHKKFYGTANTAFVLAGDYSDAELTEIIALVNEQLKDRPKGELHKFEPEEFGDFGGKIMTLAPYRDNQSVFLLQFVRPGLDEVAEPALAILSTMCTGGMSARLHYRARQAGLTYGIGSGSNTSPDQTLFAVSSQTSLEQLKPLVELAVKELADLGGGGFTDEELARAIGFRVGATRRGRQTAPQYAGWYADRFMVNMPQESPEDWVAKLQAVDRQAVLDAYKKYIRLDTSLLTLVGKDLDKKVDDYEAVLDKYLA